MASNGKYGIVIFLNLNIYKETTVKKIGVRKLEELWKLSVEYGNLYANQEEIAQIMSLYGLFFTYFGSYSHISHILNQISHCYIHNGVSQR